MGNAGGHYGVACELMLFPDDGVTFIVLSNCDVDAYWGIEMFVKQLIAGPTQDTRRYKITEILIETAVADGVDAAIRESHSQPEGLSPREGVIDLAAFKYLHRNDFEAAYNLLALNRRLFPESSDAVFNMAESLRVMRRFEEALEHYRLYLEREPQSEDASLRIEDLQATAGAINAADALRHLGLK